MRTVITTYRRDFETASALFARDGSQIHRQSQTWVRTAEGSSASQAERLPGWQMKVAKAAVCRPGPALSRHAAAEHSTKPGGRDFAVRGASGDRAPLDAKLLTKILGRSLDTYRDFATGIAVAA